MTEFIKNILQFVLLIAVFVAIAYFFWKSDLLKWQMGAILVLLLILIGTEIAALVLTFEKHLGYAAIVILPAGVIGYIYAPFGIYGIYKLSKSLNIMWPVYFTLVIFVWMLVAYIGPRLAERLKEDTDRNIYKAIKNKDAQAVETYLQHPLLPMSYKVRVARSLEWNVEGSDLIARAFAAQGQQVGGAVLCSAVQTEQISVVNVLLEEKISPNRRCDNAYLATVTNNPVILDALMAAGMDLNYRAERKAEPVFISLLVNSKKHDLSQEALLLSVLQKARIPYYSNNRGQHGETALIIAASKDYLKIAHFLLENGADPNLQNDNDETALMNAQSYKMARLLLEKNATRDLKNAGGETAADIFRRLQLGGPIAAMNNLEQPVADELITAIKTRDLATVVSLKSSLGRGPDERAVMLAALQYGTIEMLNELKSVFESEAFKYPATDYLGAISPFPVERPITEDEPANKESLAKAEWIVRNNYIFDSNQGFRKYLETRYPSGYARDAEHEETIRLQADIKIRLFAFNNPNVTRLYAERVNFSLLANLQLQKSDVKYLGPVIQTYTWEDAQTLVYDHLAARYGSNKVGDVDTFTKALILFDEWVYLHAAELEKDRWFVLREMISDVSDISQEDLAQLKQYLKQIIPRRFDIRISEKDANYLMLSDPEFARGKYDLTPFVVMADTGEYEEVQLQNAFKSASADIKYLDKFFKLAKSFAGKERRIKKHVPQIVEHFATMLVEVVGKGDISAAERIFLNFMDNIYPSTAGIRGEEVVYNISVIASQGLIIAATTKNDEIKKLVFDKLLGEKFDITKHKNNTLIYNLACYYATVKNKPAMLDAIRQARKLGKQSRQFLDDADFKGYHADTDFLRAIK